MQLPAAQTTLEPRPHRVSAAGRRAVREPERPTGDSSRFASEPARLNARGSQIPRLRYLDERMSVFDPDLGTSRPMS